MVPFRRLNAGKFSASCFFSPVPSPPPLFLLPSRNASLLCNTQSLSCSASPFLVLTKQSVLCRDYGLFLVFPLLFPGGNHGSPCGLAPIADFSPPLPHSLWLLFLLTPHSHAPHFFSNPMSPSPESILYFCSPKTSILFSQPVYNQHPALFFFHAPLLLPRPFIFAVEIFLTRLLANPS